MSSDNNGFRLTLRNHLVSTGSPVHFIGSLRNGTNNPDNRHEGWGGHTVSMIQDNLLKAGTLDQLPNLVLLHAGTNDVHVSPAWEPYATTPQRLGVLLDIVLEHCPDAVVMVALIIHDKTAQDRVDAFNEAVPRVVAERYNNGSKVALVNQTSIGFADLIDGIHPTDAGYVKMAGIWFQALRDLPKDYITKAREPATSGCGVGRISVTAREFHYAVTGAAILLSQWHYF